MIGGVIMVHGDDDGLRVPPRIAPWQIVIVPMLRDQPEDAAIVDYCKALQAELAKLSAFGEPVRALLDLKPAKAATKRWGWVKKGAPIVIEVGGRDVAGGNVSVIRRDRLYREDGKLDSAVVAQADFVGEATGYAGRHPDESSCRGARAARGEYRARRGRFRRARAACSPRARRTRAGSRCNGRSRRGPRSTRWWSG